MDPSKLREFANGPSNPEDAAMRQAAAALASPDMRSLVNAHSASRVATNVSLVSHLYNSTHKELDMAVDEIDSEDEDSIDAGTLMSPRVLPERNRNPPANIAEVSMPPSRHSK
jgi:hypothetical protein